MSVYKRGNVWWNNFTYHGIRDNRSTGQLTKDAAEAVERQRKDEARQRAHGVAIAPKVESPTFADWSEIYYADAAKRLTRPDRVEHLVRGLLRFFGPRPSKHPVPGAPYHNLRLSDVVDRPSWLLEWEAWLNEPKPATFGKGDKHAWSGQTKNQYRSTLSRMFALACKPQWRELTGVQTNPCIGQDRDPPRRRTVTLSKADVSAILEHASYHLRLAIAIALLTPKLREGDILRLRFDRNFSSDFSWLTVHGHKTERHTGRPLAAYVPKQLREILKAAKARARKDQWVISYPNRPSEYRGQAVSSLRGAVRGAVERAAETRPHLQYGRAAGVTFHTLRHSASTMLAELDVPLQKHRSMMGHERIETTLWYTHLRPTDEAVPAELLSKALPIKRLVLVDGRRPPVAKAVPGRDRKRSKTLRKTERRSQTPARRRSG